MMDEQGWKKFTGTDKMSDYRRAARQRREADELQRQARLERGWIVARRAAALLRERFQAGRVVAFGSLLRPEHYGARSDVDLAAWGLAERDYLRAVAAVTGLDGEITVDLIAMEEASASLRQRIESEGVEI